MDNENRVSQEEIVIDLKHIFEVLWKRIWLILIVSVLVAAVGFSYAAFVLTPQYSSSIMVYVNNSDISVGGASLSLSDLSAAKSLVKTYLVILKNRTTMEMIIEEAQVPYTYEELADMVSGSAVDDTEIMRVTVTTENPYEAAKIANCIAEVLPSRIQDIMEGSSMVVVDYAVPNLNKVAPSVSKYTMVGFVLGFVLIVGILSVLAIMDDSIYDEDYIVTNYGYPLLAVVPDLTETNAKGRYYYNYSSNSHSKH